MIVDSCVRMVCRSGWVAVLGLVLLGGCYGRSAGTSGDPSGYTTAANQDIREVWHFEAGTQGDCGDLPDGTVCDGSECSLEVAEYTTGNSPRTTSDGTTWFGFSSSSRVELVPARDIDEYILDVQQARLFEGGIDCRVTATMEPESGFIQTLVFFDDSLSCAISEMVFNGANPQSAREACNEHAVDDVVFDWTES